MASECDSDVSWVEHRRELPLGFLDRSLSGWTIDNERASHINAHRHHGQNAYHLKWFFHGRFSAPARREWESALQLARLDIPTVIPAGWGRHARGSYIVLESSPGFPVDAWIKHGMTVADLLPLARTLAEHVARMHAARLCHRDLNVYHVLVHEQSVRIIDVGRVRGFRRRRWVVKDLASLLDSASFEGVPYCVMRAFLTNYMRRFSPGLKRRTLIQRVVRKARRYRRHNEKLGR